MDGSKHETVGFSSVVSFLFEMYTMDRHDWDGQGWEHMRYSGLVVDSDGLVEGKYMMVISAWRWWGHLFVRTRYHSSLLDL